MSIVFICVFCFCDAIPTTKKLHTLVKLIFALVMIT